MTEDNQDEIKRLKNAHMLEKRAWKARNDNLICESAQSCSRANDAVAELRKMEFSVEWLEQELSRFQNSYMNLQKRVDTSGRVLSALMACASELEGIENPRMEGEDGIKVHTLQEAVDAISEAMGKPFNPAL